MKPTRRRGQFTIAAITLAIAGYLPSQAAEVRARALGPFSPYPGYTTASSGDVTSNYSNSVQMWTWNHRAYASFGLLSMKLHETSDGGTLGSHMWVSNEAKFTDRITIDAPGRTGTTGVVTLTWRAEGGWKLAHPTVQSTAYGIKYSANVSLGTANDAPWFEQGLQSFGTDFRNGDRNLTTSFTFGTPLDVSFAIYGGTALNQRNCEAKVAITGIWGGLPVTAESAPVSDITVVSDTGTDYLDVDDDDDGMPDGWELAYELDPQSDADADLDADGDGQKNHAEFIAGTDPRDSSSVFHVSVGQLPSTEEMSISFPAVIGHSYTVRYKQDLSPSSPWTVLQHFPAQEETSVLSVTDSTTNVVTRRFYQVVTPQQP